MTFDFTRDSAGITINDYLDEIPGEYAFAVDSLNNILSIKARDGGYQAEIKTGSDTITINGDAFSGTAAQLKAQLLTDIFASSGSGGSGATYLVYTALISQESNTAPTATVLENTTGATPAWERQAAGFYKAQLTTDGTVVCMPFGTYTNAQNYIGLYGNGELVGFYTFYYYGGYIYFETQNASGVNQDMGDFASATTLPLDLRIY